MDFYWTCKLEIKHEALSVQFNETTYWLLNGLFFHLPRRCAVHPLDSDLPSFTAVVLTFTLSYIIYLADKRKRKKKKVAGGWDPQYLTDTCNSRSRSASPV